jgi:hypothetical protein
VVYPEKYVYLGEDALGGLIKRGFQPSSADFQVPEDARHIVALLMYGFGSGVVQDPLYPWVRQNWVELASEGTGFAARLTNRAAIYLGRVLAVYRAAS